MPSIFSLPLSNWELAGVEAPAGQRKWVPDQKPPADWWNYFFNTTITSLHEIDTELQGARGVYPTTNDRLTAMEAVSAGHATATGNPHGTQHAQTNPATVNPADTNATRDKHLSNADAKVWEDHKNASGNVHGTAHGQLTNVTGAISGVDTAQTKHISDANFKAWEDHRAATGNVHGTGHAQLNSIGLVDTASSDTTRDKHVSNALAKGWEDHKNTSGNIHGTTHAQLASVGQVNPADTNATRDKHVSNADAKGWQDHLGTAADPASSDTTRNKHLSNNDLKTVLEHAAQAHVAVGHQHSWLSTSWNNARLLAENNTEVSHTTTTLTLKKTLSVVIGPNDKRLRIAYNPWAAPADQSGTTEFRINGTVVHTHTCEVDTPMTPAEIGPTQFGHTFDVDSSIYLNQTVTLTVYLATVVGATQMNLREVKVYSPEIISTF
jgi:hypothetical protein